MTCSRATVRRAWLCACGANPQHLPGHFHIPPASDHCIVCVVPCIVCVVPNASHGGNQRERMVVQGGMPTDGATKTRHFHIRWHVSSSTAGFRCCEPQVAEPKADRQPIQEQRLRSQRKGFFHAFDITSTKLRNGYRNQGSRKSARAVPGIEPGTSRTRSENHTTRPNSQLTCSRQCMP